MMFNFQKRKAIIFSLILIFCFMQTVKLTNLENRFVEERKGHFKPLTEIIIGKRGLKKQGIMERAKNKMLRDFFVFGYD
jgi:hypothetical protein